MSMAELLRWQWEGYTRYHRSRANLLVHIIAVPAFLSGNILLVVALVQRSWLVGVVGLVAMVGSMAVQGMGHGREPMPPEPFRGAGDAAARIFCEQWITFPRFVVTGAWWQAWRHGAATERTQPG